MAVFAYCASSSGDGQANYRRLHDQQLTLGQFVLLPMQTWKGNARKMFQMSTMLVSLPIKIKVMKVCSNHFWQALAGWRSIDSQFFFASCQQLSHAIDPPLCSKKGGGHKNARVISQRKLAREQNTGISTRKLALWPRKWCVSGGVS